MFVLCLGVAACVTVPPATTRPTDPHAHDVPPGVIRHEAWHVSPPLGHPADATRRNLAAGDTLAFRDLRIVVLATHVDSASAAVPQDVVELRLLRGSHAEDRTVPEGAAFNWHDHHIAVVAVYGPGELGAGLTAIEVATLASLPQHVAASTVAGDAALRLRIPHSITRVTLHHTGSAQPLRAGDDPIQRLRGLQAWGASDRNWWDLPYHFLIDLDGNVYEGRDWRYMGETNTSYNPSGHFLISVIGNYELQQPTDSQVAAIADMMAWALHRFDLPIDSLGGHYHFAGTTCPGQHLRVLLEDGTLARLVQARLTAARRAQARTQKSQTF
jgi:hypothetical protein